MKLYVTHEGVDYYGYDILWADYSRGEQHMLMDETTAKRLSVMSCLVDTSIRPKKGSSVNVIQNCVLPVACIRNHYTIKRGYDTAEYNVFSPQNIYYTGGTKIIALYPREKAAILFTYSDPTPDEIADKFQQFLPHIVVSPLDCVIIGDSSNWRGLRTFPMSYNPEPIMALLEGKLRKPAIMYDQLDLSTDNVLTVDTLHILYKLGMQDYSYDNMDKLAIQVKALEQMNIDMYPGTMSLINSIFNNSSGTGSALLGSKSRYNKTVKRLLSMNQKPTTKVDYEMGQAFMETILRMKDIKFTDIITLHKKLDTAYIPIESFMGFYDNMVKITKKTANE